MKTEEIKMKKIAYTLLITLALLLTACGNNSEEPEWEALEPLPEEAPPAPPTEIEQAPDATKEPAPTPEPTALPEPAFEPQPADGQRVEFNAEDGSTLVGYYYPASVPNAPLIILMHWAPGTQQDWRNNGMVDWLQNRGINHGMNAPTRQSQIYIPLPEGISFAVFTFDFRGAGESSGSFTREGGLLDAKAAYAFAPTLEGINPAQIAGIGSSIGADGVADGCGEGCLGALSLSPGNYLTVPYADAVKTLDDAGKPVLCLASEGDFESAPTCEGASGNHYQFLVYPGSAHGDQFFQNPPEGFGDLLYVWVLSTFGIDG